MLRKLSILSFFFLGILCCHSLHAQVKPQVYQLTIYHYHSDSQSVAIDEYLSGALLPALKRAGIVTTGVFKTLDTDTVNRAFYVLISAGKADDFISLASRLQKDKKFALDGTAFIDAPYDRPAFTRIESILLKAFSMAPALSKPALKRPAAQRIYELRSYESSSEKLYRNKVKMFNEGGEIAIFKRLNFNASFYGEVISGAKMPNLMYMTSFEDMADRDAHWKAFGSAPEWKTLSALNEYRNNVSHIDIVFLRPTSYSQL